MSEVTGTATITLFDYGLLPPDKKSIVVSATNEIRDRLGRIQQTAVEIGTRLLTVKKTLPHGAFTDWLEAEFEWSPRKAQDLMNIARAFGKNAESADLPISYSAMVLLSTADEDVQAKFIEKAESGKPVTHAEVKAAVTPPKPAPEPVPAKSLGARLGLPGEPARRPPIAPHRNPASDDTGPAPEPEDEVCETNNPSLPSAPSAEGLPASTHSSSVPASDQAETSLDRLVQLVGGTKAYPVVDTMDEEPEVAEKPTRASMPSVEWMAEELEQQWGRDFLVRLHAALAKRIIASEAA